MSNQARPSFLLRSVLRLRAPDFAHAVPILLLLGATACGSTKLTPLGPTQAPRPERCEFDLYTAMPNGSFAEIGTIDVNPGEVGDNYYKELSGFKDEIRPHVCKAGGDAAIATANGFGMWIKATVLRRVPAPDPAANTPASPPGGCQFDTQCKGDRVCQQGQCVKP